jgi:RimJ/RimL family protein N-acetyltransferase
LIKKSIRNMNRHQPRVAKGEPMNWRTTCTVEEFVAAAGPFLRTRPVEYTLELTLAERLGRDYAAISQSPPLLGWLPDGPRVAGAFVLAAPFPLIVTEASSPALVGLADTLAGVLPRLPGVDAAPDVADGFAAAWEARTGAAVERRRRFQTYQLSDLVAADPMPVGRARIAGEGDRELLLAWFDAFMREVDKPIGSVPTQVDDRVATGDVLLWEVDGAPVAMAARSTAVAGVARIGLVYTPPQARRRGYAAAATEAATRAALEHGAAEVVLFADMANPTSNAIYGRLGYRPIHERVGVAFADPPISSVRPDVWMGGEVTVAEAAAHTSMSAEPDRGANRAC